jgi:prolyl oligopeptidase
MQRLLQVALLSLVATTTLARAAEEDPYLWLEDVRGEKAIAWVKEQNAKSQAELEASPAFKPLHERLLAIYNSRERIPGVKKLGSWLYNFWQDDQSPRGLWRRTTLEEYRKAQPAWETVLDIGKLGADEKENWVWKGAHCLYPDYKRCLLELSRGGADAVVIREFDVEKREFVKGGFELPEAKTGVAWRDLDSIYVATNFGPDTLTRSGYARVLKEWRRGTPLAEAKTVFEARDTDIGVWPEVENEKGRKYERYARAIETRVAEEFIRRGDRWAKIDTPADAEVTTVHGWLLVRLRSDWKPAATTFKSGTLIAANLDKFLDGDRSFDVVFEPQPRVSLQAFDVTKSTVLLDVLDNVKGRILVARPGTPGQPWKLHEVPVPTSASIGISDVDHDQTDDYWMTVTSFIQPTTLYLAKGDGDAREKLKSLPAFFDTKGLRVEQHEATSRDGTRIPYFVVMREDAKLDGTQPTILYGYGGFEISMTPSYNATAGSAWLEKGGAWVLANLRGGGEFGPEWNRVAKREGRQRTHDDFIAVAEDLIKRGITSSRHLAVMGGSQGGLLVGATVTQRPELFHAAVIQVPLLDMKRYHKLLAGASWMGEYGDPDNPKDWEFISKYSPYQNVSKDKKYPRILFTGSIRDDRVHPGHGRKMAARMEEQGHDVLYFEYLEGGHGAGSTPTQQAYTWALTYTFLLKELR